jgi:hypothetical protein
MAPSFLQAIRNLLGQPQPPAAAPQPVAPAPQEGVPAQPSAPGGGTAPVKLVRGQPVKTELPTIAIAPMPPGTYTIAVTATDQHGVVSEPATCTIEVR